MNKGWIKIHRSLLDWEWYEDLNVRVLFMHLLITVNHEDKKWRGLHIKKGSRITGRIQLSEETGLSEQSVRTAIKKLLLTKELTIKKDPKGSMFTLVNWNKYQSTNQTANQVATKEQPEANQGATKEQPEANQGATITKEAKNNKELKELKNEGEEPRAYKILLNEKQSELETFEMQNPRLYKNREELKKCITSFNDKMDLEAAQGKIDFDANQLMPRFKSYSRNWISNSEKNTPQPDSYESGKLKYF